MPRVGKKEFAYDEPGMAAAEAEAAALDQATSALPNEVTPGDVTEEVVAETPVVGDEVAPPLDDAVMAQLFEALFAEDFDPDNPQAVEMMDQIQSFLDSNPEIAEALASGEVTVDQFAIMLRRSMEAPQGSPAETAAMA